MPDVGKLFYRLLKLTVAAVLLSLAIALAALIWLWPHYNYLPAATKPFTVERLPHNPIIHAELSPRLIELAQQQGYVNINGPSLIRVPDWIDNPLGKYYLYFAHHKGRYIRLAYADHPTGPWRIHEPGTLQLADSGFPVELEPVLDPNAALADLWQNFSPQVFRDFLLMSYRTRVTDRATRQKRGISASQESKPHIASPEVVVDDANRRVLMYYHGMGNRGSQPSRVAASTDGMHFEVLPETIPANYLRAFPFRGIWYFLGMPGVLFRSDTGVRDFEPRDRLLFEPDMRHAGLWLDDSTLYVFWSRVGDAPERILVSNVDLGSPDWDDWQATEPVELMRPEQVWEGSELAVLSSLRGELGLAANELRDPFVFEDSDGQKYLLYVGSGEQAIGIARLSPRR